MGVAINFRVWYVYLLGFVGYVCLQLLWVDWFNCLLRLFALVVCLLSAWFNVLVVVAYLWLWCMCIVSFTVTVCLLLDSGKVLIFFGVLLV